MITVENIWRRELKGLANKLLKRETQKRWTLLSEATLEREVFVGAFAVRKLMDSKKVSREISGKLLSITFYPIKTSEDPTKTLEHFTREFDLFKGTAHKLTTRALMDQFIHSHHFSPFVPFRMGMVGIFFSSDRARKSGLYYITLSKLANLFAEVGNETSRK